jgi:biotin carboxyl carrier protein
MTTRLPQAALETAPVDPRALRVSLSDGTDVEVDPLVLGPADGAPVEASLQMTGPERGRLTIGPHGASDGHTVLFEPADPSAPDGITRLHVVVDGWRVEVDLESERRAALRTRATRERRDAAGGGQVEVRAIIPGAVHSVAVVTGDEVEAGQQLLVVEAMKMQNEIRAPRAGRISRVAVGAGQTLELRDLLVVID